MRLDQLSPAEWDAAGVTQLRMGFSRFPDTPPSQPVIGYGFRTYRSGDEGAWLDTLTTGDFGEWDRARLDRMLAGERAPLPPAGVVFATSNDVPIGVANLFIYEWSGGPYSELGWVAVRPEHRGRGLAYEVCRRGLLFAKSLKHHYTYLTTEDFRLSAIKTYLRLGFEPEITEPDHRARWDELRRITAVGHPMRTLLQMFFIALAISAVGSLFAQQPTPHPSAPPKQGDKAAEDERDEWQSFGKAQLAKAYGTDEPDYSELDLKSRSDT